MFINAFKISLSTSAIYFFVFFIFSGLHGCFPFFDGVCEVFEEVNSPGWLLNDEEGPGWASLDVDGLDWLISGVDVILGLFVVDMCFAL